MAKKTNKTDRVLSLLSNDQAVEETTKETSQNSQTANKIIVTEASNVSVVNQKEEDDEIETTVEASLEKTLENSEIKTLEEQKQQEQEIKEIVIENTVLPSEKSLEVKEIKETDGHIFVNVMEYIVKLRLDEYIMDFNVCKCTRCKADIVALALTNLPAKYVVTDSHRVSPLLNFYENKYLGQVAVELTKACMRVGQVPHHRD